MRSLPAIFHSGCTMYIPTNSAQEFYFCAFSATLTISHVFESGQSGRCEITSCMINLRFPDDYGQGLRLKTVWRRGLRLRQSPESRRPSVGHRACAPQDSGPRQPATSNCGPHNLCRWQAGQQREDSLLKFSSRDIKSGQRRIPSALLISHSCVCPSGHGSDESGKYTNL